MTVGDLYFTPIHKSDYTPQARAIATRCFCPPERLDGY